MIDDDGPIFYQAIWRNAHDLARYDTIVDLVKERYGEGAGQVVNSILQSGMARVGDVADSYDFSANIDKRDNGVDTTVQHAAGEGAVNGVSKSNGYTTQSKPVITSLSELHRIMRVLLDAKILVKAGIRSYEPAADRDELAREQIINERFPDGRITGSKKAKEFGRAVNALKRQIREEDEYSESRDLRSKVAVLVPGNPNKRLKLNAQPSGGSTHGGDESIRMVTVR